MKTGLSQESQIPRLSVVDSHPNAPQDDEVILCVRYPNLRGWLAGICAIFLGTIPWYGVNVLVLRGDYVRGFILVVFCLMFFSLGVEVLFTKHILFYRDRIVKAWHLFGQRTIPYARARLVATPPSVGYKWIKVFSIQEADGTGKIYTFQMPIRFTAHFVSWETRRKVETVTSYLVDLEDRSKLYEESRIFAKSTLPKEILCQDQEKTYNSWLGLKL
jgi:hypothetical protein